MAPIVPSDSMNAKNDSGDGVRPQPAPDFTADELEQIIANAIKAADFPAVIAAIKYLAIVDPDRAEAVLATIDLGLAIGRSRD